LHYTPSALASAHALITKAHDLLLAAASTAGSLATGGTATASIEQAIQTLQMSATSIKHATLGHGPAMTRSSSCRTPMYTGAHAPSGTSQCTRAASNNACPTPKFLQQAYTASLSDDMHLHECQERCITAPASGAPLLQDLACQVPEPTIAVLNGADQFFIVVSALAMVGRAAPLVVDACRLQALIKHEAKQLQMSEAAVGDLVMHWHKHTTCRHPVDTLAAAANFMLHRAPCIRGPAGAAASKCIEVLSTAAINSAACNGTWNGLSMATSGSLRSHMDLDYIAHKAFQCMMTELTIAWETHSQPQRVGHHCMHITAVRGTVFAAMGCS
jgi:hypothetical protein